MQVVVDFCLVPSGVGLSLSPYIAAAEEVLEAHQLTYELHPNGTAIEGEWDQVIAAIKACHERVHAMGAVRIHTSLKIGTRTDRVVHLRDKVHAVEAQLKHHED
jgi:uncharacterized protein (TIGR00106 family)